MGRVVIGTLMRPRCNAGGGQWAPSRVHKGHMMDGSDHSRHALARRGPEMDGQGPQGRLEVCPIELDTVQLNWTWFFSRGAGNQPKGKMGL